MRFTTTTRRYAVSLLLAAFALSACSEAPAVLPPDAPGVTIAKDDAFTDAVRTADKQSQKDVLDQLASRFGRDLRILPRRVDSDAEPLPIKEHYEKELAGARGWKEFPLTDYGSTWSFAYISPDNRQVFAAVVLNPRFAPEGGGDVPLTILTNLPDAR
ncbi:hypothetical protein [Methylobacterium gnaphalii]|uniref:Lipoprotein n=1 Tax=Methylobacterium gnaphalii TaxID=1010610 RepID=A0A512JHU8_9HYPH|nr:hypothetical protein [Methylobacterium gnaphalii]GEP09530.1 hypothetical protein MGN01_13750 [Methylobacterium gnaphalii]GJD69951.1 hypothetical protein MMMDOFMJ_2890 [Methylobacterium gnaphalii]GLS48172.1 hypothetical protein GCM10007885_10160 [Methylobacterium gnaphalii]